MTRRIALPMVGRRLLAVCAGVAFAAAGGGPTASAQPLEIALGTGPGDQWNAVACADAAGGAFVAWLDRRDGLQTDVWAQHLDANGATASGWPANAAPVCDAAGDQTAPFMATDATGGAWVVWEDRRGGTVDLRVQHLLAASPEAPGWPRNGLVLCAAAGLQLEPVVAADGAGGVFVAWSDYRAGVARVYAHHVTPSGLDPAWPVDGWLVCEAPGMQRHPAIAADRMGGVLIAWQDTRNGGADLYAAHVTAARDRPWGGAGRALCTASGEQRGVRAAADGTGGGYFVWEDVRGANFDVYGLRVAPSGDLDFPWVEDGLPLCAQPGVQLAPQIESDGAGGLLIAWMDSRRGSDFDIYALRINARAEPLAGWQNAGTLICGANGDQLQPALAGDGRGGAWISWADRRDGTLDIALQHLDASGQPTVYWPQDGILVGVASYDQEHPALVGGPSSAAVAWTDLRSNVDGDVYARSVQESLPYPPVDVHGVAVCVQPGIQSLGTSSARERSSVSDGAGGAWVVWEDGRDASTAPDLYAQHLGPDAHPAPGWPADGVPVCVAPGAQTQAVVTPVAGGGCAVAWTDERQGPGAWRVYLQQLDAGGNRVPGFGVNGVPMSGGPAVQLAPALVADAAGTLWMAWQQNTRGDFDIVLQSFGPAGPSAPRWPGAGFELCNAPLDQVEPLIALASDGVTVLWRDHRNGAGADLFGSSVRASGALRSGWAGNGNVICDAAGDQFDAVLAADGADGLFVAWRDRRTGRDAVMARRVLQSGSAAPGWAPGGVVLANNGDERGVRVVADGAGGAYFGWIGMAGGRSAVLVARRSADGTLPPGWTTAPRPVSGPAPAFSPAFASDGHHGLLTAWSGYYNVSLRLFAQRVRADGGFEGGASGVRVCNEETLQYPAVLVADREGRAVALWSDWRGASPDLYGNPVRILPPDPGANAGAGAIAAHAAQSQAIAARICAAAGAELRGGGGAAVGGAASAGGLQNLKSATPANVRMFAAAGARGLWVQGGALSGPVAIDLFDVRGRRIGAWTCAQPGATVECPWTRGVPPAAGSYLLRISGPASARTLKVLVH